MRSFNLLTFFILSSVATHLCHAGVITASPDGKPTKWVSDAGTTYDLYEDSFYDAFLSNYDDNVIVDFSETEATNLASSLCRSQSYVITPHYLQFSLHTSGVGGSFQLIFFFHQLSLSLTEENSFKAMNLYWSALGLLLNSRLH